MEDIIIDGMIKGMEELGAIFIRRTRSTIHFEIPEKTLTDNQIKRSESAFKKYGLLLKIEE